MLSKRNSGKSAVSSASSSVRLDPTENPSSKTIMAPIARSSTGKAKDEVDEPTPSAKTVEKSLKTEEKESAPIFALFHGKIVPLGKLPDTSFKKSHAEVRSDEKQSKEESKKEETGKAEIKETHQVKSDIGEHTKEGENTKPKQNIEKRQQGRTLSPSQISRLSSYFHNLESKSKEAVETRMIKSHKKDVTGTAKDEVPELLPDVKNSEFLKHVKGILLDDGKMVALKGKQSQIEEQVSAHTLLKYLGPTIEKELNQISIFTWFSKLMHNYTAFVVFYCMNLLFKTISHFRGEIEDANCLTCMLLICKLPKWIEILYLSQMFS